MATKEQKTASAAAAKAVGLGDRVGKGLLGGEAINPTKIRALDKAGADVEARDSDRRTALMVAALNGHPDCVQALLEAGALADAVDPKGFSALIYAARNQELACAGRLIAAGADALFRDKEALSALDWERESRSTELADLLLAARDAQELRASVASAPVAIARPGL